MDDFTTAYLGCALWSTSDCAAEGNCNGNLDDTYNVDDFTPEALAQAEADCAAFCAANAADLAIVAEDGEDDAKAGHDFWLTRNGHGAGFWDRYYGKDAALRAAYMRLSDAAKVYGGVDYMPDGNGKVG